MVATSPAYSTVYTLRTNARNYNLSKVIELIEKHGGVLKKFQTFAHLNTYRLILTCDLKDSEQADNLAEDLRLLDEYQIESIADETFFAHIGGKLSVELKQKIQGPNDLSRVYTPGVARVCSSIKEDEQKARLFTIKSNSIAVVTDGTAVLGLGDIGPKAALPVMEGKAALFKQFAGIDAWPVCLDTKEIDEIVNIVCAIAPQYGGINLEDIAAPKCFLIERELRRRLDIPVFHDDQHGTAIVVLASLLNALRIVDKEITELKVIVSGVGAAGTSIIKLLYTMGVRNIIGYGRTGALNPDDTEGMNEDRANLAKITNPNRITGGLKEGIKGADVFIGVSSGNLLDGDDIGKMNRDPIVFALSNPTPEVDPNQARKYARILATGRSDYPNQINNVLVFPGLFRGMLDSGARKITMGLMVECAKALSRVVTADELSPEYIVPDVFNEKVVGEIARAVYDYCSTHKDINPLQNPQDINLGGYDFTFKINNNYRYYGR